VTKKQLITVLEDLKTISDLDKEALALKYMDKNGFVNWHTFINVLAKPRISHTTGQRILLLPGPQYLHADEVWTTN